MNERKPLRIHRNVIDEAMQCACSTSDLNEMQQTNDCYRRPTSQTSFSLRYVITILKHV